MSVRFAPIQFINANGWQLFFEGNSKITGHNGSFEEPAANSFSVIHVADCPGSTPTCRASCYVHGLEKAEKQRHDHYKHNSWALHIIFERCYEPIYRRFTGRSDDWMATAEASAKFIRKRAARGFRWHVSGDIFSVEYAMWIADVCRLSADVPHWIYTRSFQLAGPIFGIPNLVVNLSADRDNYKQALFTRAVQRAKWGDAQTIRIAYLSSLGEVPTGLPKGSVIFPDYDLRGRDLDKPTEAPWWQTLTPEQRRMVCPVDHFGASRSIRCGVCKKCM